MSIDVNKALITFIAEAEELINDIEQLLLDNENATQWRNIDWLHEVFRGVHTIKGSAGLFGLDELVNFSHLLESLLERLRSQSLDIDAQIMALVIESTDVIKIHIASIGVGQSDELAVKSNRLAKKIADYLPKSFISEQRPVSEKADITDSDSADNSEMNGIWHISFRPQPNVFQDGLDPISFIRYLSTQGELVSVHLIDEDLDTGKEYQPSKCYLGFEIRFQASTTRRAILDAFEFILNDADLIIIPPDSQVDSYIDLINKLPESSKKLGEILVEVDALTQEQLNDSLNIQHNHKTSHQPAPLLGSILTQRQNVPSEVIMAAVKKQRPNISVAKTLRVEAAKLDQLIDLVGEMVITGARTNLLAHETGNEMLIEAMAQLERLVENIRDSSLQLRMVQIGDTFKKYKRIIRDSASDLGKDVELIITGAETELDKTFVEKLSDPLTHLIRNAIDHGIESCDEREALGKSRKGVIRLNAFHDSGSIVIEVSDDGQGLNDKNIASIALQKGLIDSINELNAQELQRLIFEPGFSTKSEVSDLSGRGVGMDVVKQNIESLRGTIELESEAGVGSRFIIRLPLTLSIIDGFMFQVSGGNYVIPLDNVIECLELNEITSEEAIRHKKFVDLRDSTLPIMRLSEWFGVKSHCSFEQEALIVVQFGSFRAGLIVDTLSGEYQTVVKPLGPIFEGLKGVSGATILGSGDVAIILDVLALIQTVLNRSETESSQRLRNE
ncbi:chemotaxis protein CheA [Vibrio genomosp. F10]|uniref:chemotaxis protein CheA n=1 Tax=Vibrio genomosp. F10 TaxID=723171 RepID=UPI0002D9F7AD|nr:chemotaxis protein CheA [Vibrio genomosp. F10]OEF11193.1 chemotaxis protein CheA [Vibrio genomosp. F10 str. 9ZD137]